MGGRRMAMLVLLLLAALALAPAHAQGPDPASRPAAASRYVAAFDFEEHNTNPNPVPRYWARVYDEAMDGAGKPVRPAFPKWNQAELAFSSDGFPTASGEGSVRLPCSGGSTRLILEPSVIPVFAGADYRVSAMVRTEGLVHARARVSIRFLDRAGKPIGASERTSDLITSEAKWTSLAIELVGEHPAAAFLQLQLDLLQPSSADPEPKPTTRALPEDFSGNAYFDDILVIQLPRAELTTSSPLNLVVAPEKPQLVTRVRDLTGEKLSVQLDVYDARGALVDSHIRPIPGGTDRVTYEPELSTLGWYRAVMTIRAGARQVGADVVDFAWLPPSTRAAARGTGQSASPARLVSPDRQRFAFIAGPLEDRVLAQVAELPRRVGIGAITLDATNASTASESALAKAVYGLLNEYQEVTLAVRSLSIASKSADRPLEALASDKSAIQALEPLLDRFGQRIRRYQFGRLDDDSSFWESEPPDPAKVVKALLPYVSGPVVATPMRLDRVPWTSSTPSVDSVFFVPYALQPDAIAQGLLSIKRPTPKAGERQGVTLALECAPEGQVPPRAAAADLARRVVEIWAADPANVPCIGLVNPWSIVGPRRPQMLPRAEIAAWRVLVDRLSDRRVVGRFPSPAGTTAYLLAPVSASSRSGAIVAWNDSAQPDQAFIESYLGNSELRIVDIFGNEKVADPAPKPEGATRETGVHIALSTEPIFIEGVDIEFAKFLADFQVDPAFIEPGHGGDAHELVLRNPFRSGLAGTITLIHPSRDDGQGPSREWRISPRVMRFSAGPGEETRIPISIGAGPGLELGPQHFVFQVELSADRQYPPIEVRRELMLGLSSLKVDLSYRVQNSTDLILEAALTNISERPLNLSVTAFAPQRPRQPSSVSGLMPNSQVIRRFVYPNMAEQFRGQRLSITVSDLDSGVRLSTSVAVE